MAKQRLQGNKFPADLARHLVKGWSSFIMGDHIPPTLPSERQLRYLLEVAYLASMETDEARPISFFLCCLPVDVDKIEGRYKTTVEAWQFENDREYSVQELRRLAVAIDVNSSALWIRFSSGADQHLSIHGLVNLGPSWARARLAHSYAYDPLPSALLIRSLSPGHLVVYQGEFAVASLRAGKIQVGGPSIVYMDLLGAYPLITEGSELVASEIEAPEHDPPHEWWNFHFGAYVNVILAIVNTMLLRGHGGALILASQDCRLLDDGYVRPKYRLSPSQNHLRGRYLTFMTLRNRLADKQILAEQTAANVDLISYDAETYWIESDTRAASLRLADTCEFVGGLSGTDGALVLRTDLSVEGFGAEILMDKIKPTKFFKVSDPARKNDREELDSEQYGMRHRSAIRLCSAVPDCVVFIVSQDGGASLVWNDGDQVCFKPGIVTTNTNMVLA